MSISMKLGVSQLMSLPFAIGKPVVFRSRRNNSQRRLGQTLERVSRQRVPWGERECKFL
jgi:hypothetical protein